MPNSLDTSCMSRSYLGDLASHPVSKNKSLELQNMPHSLESHPYYKTERYTQLTTTPLNMALDTSKLFRKEFEYQACPIFWGTHDERYLVKDILVNTIDRTVLDQWPNLKCYCGFSPLLGLCKKSDPKRVYLKCGSDVKSKMSCCYFQWVDKPLDRPNEEKPEDVAPPDATNPFALSAREQQRKRKLIKPATLNPWGTPQPEGKAPYLAITEDGLAITQDGTYAMYKVGMTVASPRFKQLYQYHKSQPFHHTSPVTERWLEGRYGQFVLPLESDRRRRLLNYHNATKQGFEKMFSMEELEKKHGHKVKEPPQSDNASQSAAVQLLQKAILASGYARDRRMARKELWEIRPQRSICPERAVYKFVGASAGFESV